MKSLLYVFIFLTFTLEAKPPTDRHDEVRDEMWLKADKTFRVVDIPAKWNERSAVIIAQLNRYEYRKPVMRNLLRYNEYNHYRIKLLDKNAVSEYSEMTYLPSRTVSSEGEEIKVYSGFKIIKPDGREVMVDKGDAVSMEREYNGRKQSYFKLAIPNLEPGDILDYYICEEVTRAYANLIHFFDPVIFTLPQEYPVMSHKLQFRVERRCFINVKSLNGAPNLKMVIDEENDEKYYSLDGTDLESVQEKRWFYPYRELPTIKFRAAFATGKAMRTFDVFLGEPGEVKSSVSKAEVQQMAQTMLSTPYDVKDMSKYAKKKLKGVKDPFEIATQAYYFYRNDMFNTAESNAVAGNSPWDTKKEIVFVDRFSTFLKSKKISHDIILAVPRNIGSIKDLLMENELEWFIRVKKGNEYLYLQPFDMHTLPGKINPMVEGTEAYAIDGLRYTSGGAIQTITLPLSNKDDHSSISSISVDLGDLTKAKVTLMRTLKGSNKSPDQYIFMDPFDIRAEEAAKFEMNNDYYDAFVGKKKYQAQKDAYLSKREKEREDDLKARMAEDFDLKIEEINGFKIEQTGRYQASPEMIYRLDFVTTNLVNRVGPNYMIDAGKLIEQQVKIESEELSRKENVYYPNPRTYKCIIEITIPKGYQAQGLDKFNRKVENKIGGFTSTAVERDGKIVIETNKHYDVNYADAALWTEIVAFINAANEFNDSKILLKKN
jgi:Domain of Unknown Function with PDB structure (DUF3857)